MDAGLTAEADPRDQQDVRIRFETGLEGALAVARGPRVLAVVVDVLSFSTAVSVAADRGTAVLPYAGPADEAASLAKRIDAVLAEPRSLERPSLSPASLRRAPRIDRLVLPSPNGSTICAALAATGASVVAGCLRNARAVARRADAHLARPDAVVAVVAAGERWPDGSLRVAVEDLWGAGAVLAALRSPAPRSPEALAAAAASRSCCPAALRTCASGRELVGRGFAEDVEIAGELDASDVVPMLRDGRFIAG